MPAQVGVATMLSDGWMWDNLACPRDGTSLSRTGDSLRCQMLHDYPVVDGVPILLLDDVEQTLWVANASLRKSRESTPLPLDPAAGPVHPFVQEAVAATSGYMYKPLVGKLNSYPIPRLRLPVGHGQPLLDVGCNWGRWTIAAAQAGYIAVGIDPNFDAVLAAGSVAQQLQVDAAFLVADARYLPFRDGAFDTVFSYSVIQHFSKENAKRALRQVRRVLSPRGRSFIQMPNRWGVRSLYHQLRRGFAEGQDFDVRYWRPRELESTFTNLIGPSRLSVDGFFGLGIQPSDIDLLPTRYQVVVRCSEVLRKLSERVGWLRNVADSLYITSEPAPTTSDDMERIT